jgi:hypothetical protein
MTTKIPKTPKILTLTDTEELFLESWISAEEWHAAFDSLREILGSGDEDAIREHGLLTKKGQWEFLFNAIESCRAQIEVHFEEFKQSKVGKKTKLK